VLRVLDSVTLEVSIDGQIFQVRYIGIAPPVIPDPTNQDAAALVHRQLVEGKEVLLVRERTDTDESGRLIRYVISGDTLVNLELVQTGYAIAQSSPPNIACDSLFEQAQVQASAEQVGMWAVTPTPTRSPLPPTATLANVGKVDITTIRYWGVGWQDPNEFIEIHNISGYPIQMQGWKLRNQKGQTYIFPDFILQTNQYCQIFTNWYEEGSCGLSFDHPAQIWDDEGDCAYLYDAQDTLIDQYCYE
jgi:hypothetical protein